REDGLPYALSCLLSPTNGFAFRLRSAFPFEPVLVEDIKPQDNSQVQRSELLQFPQMGQSNAGVSFEPEVRRSHKGSKTYMNRFLKTFGSIEAFQAQLKAYPNIKAFHKSSPARINVPYRTFYDWVKYIEKQG